MDNTHTPIFDKLINRVLIAMCLRMLHLLADGFIAQSAHKLSPNHLEYSRLDMTPKVGAQVSNLRKGPSAQSAAPDPKISELKVIQ